MLDDVFFVGRAFTLTGSWAKEGARRQYVGSLLNIKPRGADLVVEFANELEEFQLTVSELSFY